MNNKLKKTKHELELKNKKIELENLWKDLFKGNLHAELKYCNTAIVILKAYLKEEKIFNYTSSTAITLVGVSWVIMFYSIIKNHHKNN